MTWLDVKPGMCLLGADGQEWWVTDQRRGAEKFEWLLERAGQRVIVAKDLDDPVTAVIYGYEDRVELAAMILQSTNRFVELHRGAPIVTAKEVVTSPDTKGHRVPG